MKQIRYILWFVSAFIRKHIVLLATSFVISFFGIFFFMYVSPSLYTVFYQEKKKIGLTGSYRVENPPEEVVKLISSPLIDSGLNGEAIPVLVASWEVTDDNLNYRFYIKQDLKWSNGDTFNAEDIDFSFKGVKETIIDDYTIEYSLPQPLSLFPFYLSKPLVRYPLIGVNGFYSVDSFRQKDGILSEVSLNPESADLPYLIYRFYESEDKLISAYKLGRITEFSTYKKETGDIFSTWKNTNVEKSPDYTRLVTVFFNTSDTSIFSDRDIRKAFVYSLGSFDEYGVKAISPIQPVSWAHNKNTRTYTEDIDRAKELYSPDSNASESSKISLYTFYDYLGVAQKIKENTERIGFSVSVSVVSYIPEKFDILLTSWSPPIDPDQYYYWHSSQKEGNITKLNNPRIDKILEDGRKTFNKDERKELYFEFQRIFMEELPAYFLYHPYEYTIKRK